jgi:hypothetical protein
MAKREKSMRLIRHSELAREKMWARIHLIPALQAEEDRDQVRRYLADKAREKELLGSETKIYNSDRYVMKHHLEQEEQMNDWLQVRPANLRDYSRARDEVGRSHTRIRKVIRAQYVHKNKALWNCAQPSRLLAWIANTTTARFTSPWLSRLSKYH